MSKKLKKSSSIRVSVQESNIRDQAEAERKITYDTKNHFQVIFQQNGSVWPSVLPHCCVNVLWASTIIYLDRIYDIDLSFSDKGHTFISMVVSFLIVTRSSITYSRFMEASSNLSTVMRSCRELVQYAITFTRHDNSKEAQQWRYAVARKTIVLLRSVVSVLQFETTGEYAWALPALSPQEREAVQKAVQKDHFRTPNMLAMFLRSTIAANANHLKDEMHVNRELRLFQFVSEFIEGYHGLIKLIDTQFPFPLAQMNRTFVYFWVYTLPLVLYNDAIKTPSLIMMVFFITYAFVGLECVSIELDDPYGDDPNDLDVLGKAKVVFQDIYICIYDVDGFDKADELREFFEVKACSQKPQKRRDLLRSDDAPQPGDDKSYCLNATKATKLNPLSPVVHQRNGYGATFFSSETTPLVNLTREQERRGLETVPSGDSEPVIDNPMPPFGTDNV